VPTPNYATERRETKRSTSGTHYGSRKHIDKTVENLKKKSETVPKKVGNKKHNS
jgi:hypothetical protein